MNCQERVPTTPMLLSLLTCALIYHSHCAHGSPARAEPAGSAPSFTARASRAAAARPFSATAVAVPNCGVVHGREEFRVDGEPIAKGPIPCRAERTSNGPVTIVRRERLGPDNTVVCRVMRDERPMRTPGGGDAVVEWTFKPIDPHPPPGTGASSPYVLSSTSCRWKCRYQTGYRCVKPANVPVGAECVCQVVPPFATLVKN